MNFNNSEIDALKNKRSKLIRELNALEEDIADIERSYISCLSRKLKVKKALNKIERKYTSILTRGIKKYKNIIETPIGKKRLLELIEHVKFLIGEFRRR